MAYFCCRKSLLSYFENYEEEVSDNDFEGGFDDFEGLDDFDI